MVCSGPGKSHALLWAQHYILHECRKEMNAVCYFVPTLRKDKGQMTFAGAFHEDVLERGGLLEELRQFGEFLAAATRDARASEVEATESVLKRLVPSYEHRNLASELIARKDDPSKMRDLVLPPPRERTDYQAMAMFTRLINLFVHDLEVSDSETRRFQERCISVHRRVRRPPTREFERSARHERHASALVR